MDKWEEDMDNLHEAFKIGRKRRRFKSWIKANAYKIITIAITAAGVIIALINLLNL